MFAAGKYMAIQEFGENKKDSHSNAVFLGEGIFTMGYSKNLYNVLGGFYGYYISMEQTKSVHKVHKNAFIFLCIFTTAIISGQ